MQKKVKGDGPTDRPTDRPTDTVTYRVAFTRLKTVSAYKQTNLPVSSTYPVSFRIEFRSDICYQSCKLISCLLLPKN